MRCLEIYRTFPDVHLGGLGCPSPSRLYKVRQHALLGKTQKITKEASAYPSMSDRLNRLPSQSRLHFVFISARISRNRWHSSSCKMSQSQRLNGAISVSSPRSGDTCLERIRLFDRSCRSKDVPNVLTSWRVVRGRITHALSHLIVRLFMNRFIDTELCGSFE